MTAKTKRRRRRLNAKGVAALIILLGLVGAAAYMLLKPLQSLPAERKAFEKMSFYADEEHYFSGESFFVVRGDELHNWGIQSEKNNWDMKLTGAGYRIAASTSIIAVYGKNILQGVDHSGTALFPGLEFTGELVDVRCGKDYIAALKLDPTGEYMLYAFNKKGERVDILYFDDMYPLDFGFYQPGDKLWTLALNTNSVTPASVVTNYDTQRAVVGRIPIEAQTASGVYFDGNGIYIPATNSLLSYDNAGKELTRTLIYGWQALDFQSDGSKPMFLLVNRDDFPSQTESVGARIIQADGTNVAEFRLPPNTLNAYMMGDEVLAVTDDTLYTFSQKGELTGSVPTGINVNSAEKLDAKRLLLKSANELYLYCK